MTWSVVAYDAERDAFAVAVTTSAFAVGSRCPFVRSGVGAVASQSISSWYAGRQVLDLMEAGAAPADAITEALARDEGRHLRQVHAVDRHGRAAAWTGRHCVAWAGHRAGTHFSVAGNMLAGEGVVDATFDAFAARGDLRLPDRLVTALDAGQAAGGDHRGTQSAALLLATTEEYPDMDLRVDDAATPLVELRRLIGVYRRDVEPALVIRPTRANPSGVVDLERIEADWRSRGADLRFRR